MVGRREERREGKEEGREGEREGGEGRGGGREGVDGRREGGRVPNKSFCGCFEYKSRTCHWV